MPGVTRGISPIIIGRDAELERLRATVASLRTDASGMVLVSGEAGIGKSRLIADWEAAATAAPPGGRPVRFLHAACIEMGERLAFLPVLDWLDELSGDEADIAEAAADLKVAFGGSELVDIEGETSESSRGARFTRLRDLLVRTARDRDVVAVIDDLHWADRSTLDVVTFLARRLAKTGVLLVAAFRSDELHRRHPLTAPLADLERHATLEHVRLQPLAPADVACQVIAIEGENDDPARVDRTARIVELADGNPFHVEELLAIDRAGPLPSTLRDVLASRLAQVDDATMAVLREAAVIGRRVDAELLVAISRDDRAAVETALRAAADARILVTADDGRRVQFRHALLREAVYDEVLASERAELHRRIAAGLTERPDLGDPSPATASAELARHWLAAGSWSEALVTLIKAARTSASAVAWAEARWALEEALGLWDRVPDAEALADMPRHVALNEAASYAWYQGDSRRAIELNRRAQREPAVVADPDRLGSLLVRAAWYHGDLGESDASMAAIERAVEIIPADPPSQGRALALGTLGATIGSRGRVIESIGWLEQGAQMAAALGDTTEAAADLSFLGPAYAQLGREGDAVATTADVRRILSGSDRAGMDDAFFAFASNEPWVWVELGREAATIASVENFFVEARERGVEASIGPWLVAPMAFAQFRLGRWTAALATTDAAAAYDPTLGPVSLTHAIRALVLAGRGAFDDARSVAARADATARAGSFDEHLAARIAIAWTELLAGDPATAAAAVELAVDRYPTDELTSLRAELVWMAAWTAADGAARRDADATSKGRFDRLAAVARGVVGAQAEDGATDETGRLGGIDRWLRLAAAELDRLDQRDTPETWSSLADQLEAIDNLAYAAIARLREAAVRLSRGDDRALVEAALRSVLGHAEEMGATVFRDRAHELARVGRITFGDSDATEASATPTSASSVADPWGLSAREREVLGLLVDGRTNVQIGAALFISDKTASVHVTHILDKLGVDSRVEAALLAVRAGFVAPAEAAD